MIEDMVFQNTDTGQIIRGDFITIGTNLEEHELESLADLAVGGVFEDDFGDDWERLE